MQEIMDIELAKFASHHSRRIHILDNWGKNWFGTDEGKEYRYQENRELALPPYFFLVQENGYLIAQVDIFKNQIEELKTKIKKLEDQLTYQKTSWIKRIFKR